MCFGFTRALVSILPLVSGFLNFCLVRFSLGNKFLFFVCHPVLVKINFSCD